MVVMYVVLCVQGSNDTSHKKPLMLVYVVLQAFGGCCVARVVYITDVVERLSRGTRCIVVSMRLCVVIPAHSGCLRIARGSLWTDLAKSHLTDFVRS